MGSIFIFENGLLQMFDYFCVTFMGKQLPFNPTRSWIENISRAIASEVKGGDNYRGPRLRGAPRRSQPIGWGQPKKTLRKVDGKLLRVVTRAYHLHVFLSLANLNIQKSLKHSNKRRGKAQISIRAVFSAYTESRVSWTTTPNRTLLRVLLHLNEQIQIAV